jgi:hypothetical protein
MLAPGRAAAFRAAAARKPDFIELGFAGSRLGDWAGLRGRRAKICRCLGKLGRLGCIGEGSCLLPLDSACGGAVETL